MTIKIDRKYKKDTYTIGNVYVDGKWLCSSLEDRDRGLEQTDSVTYIRGVKVPGETAIPTGRYRITMDVVSPKYNGVKWYRDFCGGRMPRLLNVPGFEGILIHPGNGPLDTSGCILVGLNTSRGRLTASRAKFQELYKMLKKANDRHELIYIEIA